MRIVFHADRDQKLLTSLPDHKLLTSLPDDKLLTSRPYTGHASR
jgi:hypothetical protein